VHVIWTKKHLRRSARLLSRFMPRLWVLIYPKGAYELLSDHDFQPELSDRAWVEATTPVAQWKPDVMN
jgi:hypothetical protein